MSASQKLQNIRGELQHRFLERHALIDGALAALLASQHVLIVGPPGTAKSMLADELCRRITGARYFQWLLTKFTTPEELFGAVSLKALEADDYRRVTDHKLPDAHIAFLDEVFKSSSSILNSILTIINERVFHNGRQSTDVPLLTLFGASNELPEDEELVALYDRFLLRFTVEYIQEDFRFLHMLRTPAPAARTTLSLAELGELQAAVRAVDIPDAVLAVMAEIRRELRAKAILASDRRYRQSVDLLRAVAYLDGRRAATQTDLFVLEHVLWKEPSEQAGVRAVIHGLMHGHEDEVQALLFQTRELRDYAERSWDDAEQRARAVIEVHTKIRNILSKVDEIHQHAKDVGRAIDQVESARQEIHAIQGQLLEKL